ncbi:MAG: 30S ribosomal protein S21, partial [Cyanobacteria bacterium J06642_11]
MAQVILGDDEGIESALRRFKRKVVQAGIFSDMKKHRYFETPAEKLKRRSADSIPSSSPRITWAILISF